ncbi:MAG: hypothetical protein RL172_1019 [Bacteroidota bacterium]|jgi:hypothetical protein
MKYTGLFLAVSMLLACSDAFVNHQLKAEKIGGCTGTPSPVKMQANIAGQRYTFVTCLDDNFDNSQYQLQRSGDTLVLSFTGQGRRRTAYNITVDIDAKPMYKYILLDGQGINLAP